MINALERKGYVSRSEDPNDARAVNLRITQQGRNLYNRIELELMEITARLAADFEPEVCRAATELMTQFARAAMDRITKGKT